MLGLESGSAEAEDMPCGSIGIDGFAIDINLFGAALDSGNAL